MPLLQAHIETYSRLGKEITSIKAAYDSAYSNSLTQIKDAEDKIYRVGKVAPVSKNLATQNKLTSTQYDKLNKSVTALSLYKSNWDKAWNIIKDAQFDFDSNRKQLATIENELNTLLVNAKQLGIDSSKEVSVLKEIIASLNKCFDHITAIVNGKDSAISDVIEKTKNVFSQIQRPAGPVDTYAKANNALAFQPPPRQQPSTTPNNAPQNVGRLTS